MTSLHTDLDLTDAVEAAARHHWEYRNPALAPWDDVVTANPALAHDIREHVLPAVTAAAPVIAAAAVTAAAPVIAAAALTDAALDEPATCDHERAARYLATASTLTDVEARILIDALTPPTLPSVEDVARAILMVTQAADVDPDYAWSVQYPEVQDELLDQARAVLALLPGRTEAEVKAEALRDAAGAVVAEEFLRALPPAEYGENAVESAAAWLRRRADLVHGGA